MFEFYYLWQDELLCLHKLYHNTTFKVFNAKNNFHQDNYRFVCFQIYKHNFLNILAERVSCNMSNKSIQIAVKDSQSVSSSPTSMLQKLV